MKIEERETWAAVAGWFPDLAFGRGMGAEPDFGGHVSREVTLCLFASAPLGGLGREGSGLLKSFKTGVKFSSMNA